MKTDSSYGVVTPNESDTNEVSANDNDGTTLFIKPPCNRRYSRIILDFSDEYDEYLNDNETLPDDNENLLKYEPLSGDLVQPSRETIADDEILSSVTAAPAAPTVAAAAVTEIEREPEETDELLRKPPEEYDSLENEREQEPEQEREPEQEPPETKRPNYNDNFDVDYLDVEQRIIALTSEISALLIRAEQMLANSEKRMNEIEAEIREYVHRNETRHENSEKLLRDLDEDLKGHLRINELWRENSENMLKEIVSDVKEHIRRNDERNGYTDGILKKIVTNTDDLSRRHVEEVQFLYDELQKREQDLFREIQLPVALDFIDVVNNLRNIIIQSKNISDEHREEYLARELESCVKFADGRLSNRRINAFSDLSDTSNPPRFNETRHLIERRGIVLTRSRPLHDCVAESLSPGYEWYYDDSRSRVIRKETVKVFEYKKDDDYNKLRL